MWSVRVVLVAVLLCVVSGDRYHGAHRTSRGAVGGRLVGDRLVGDRLVGDRLVGDRLVGDRLVRELDAEHWREQAAAAVQRRAALVNGPGRARNVVMFLGDGMSVPTLAAARTLLGQRRGDTGEEAHLTFETFPTVGLSKTYCVDAQIPDSACTATAYLCGVKNNEGTIGVSGRVPRSSCSSSADTAEHVTSIAQWALDAGLDAGIVTTTRVTHASPAGAYAKVADRYWESDADVAAGGAEVALCPDIAQQLVTMAPGNQFKVILGGGRREFLPNTTYDEEGTQGRRIDGRNLIDEWQSLKASQNVSHQYVWNREQLMNLNSSPPEYLLGLFEGSHLQYHMQGDPTTEPTLAELTEVAIRSLSRNENGFFLFVEGGRIDHAHHDNYVELALDETIEMDLAVQRAMELLSEEDSLIVVTADHAHVMAFNGYTHRGGDILGPSDEVGDDGVPYMTLSYTNGPGARAAQDNSRVDVTLDDNYRELEWRSHAEIPLAWETHGGDDVAVFAWGPQHAMFSGLYEQNELPLLMAYAACIGPGPSACRAASAGSRHGPPALAQLTALTLLALLALLALGAHRHQ